MSDYMKTQGLVDAATGARNRQRELEADAESLRNTITSCQIHIKQLEDENERLRDAVTALLNEREFVMDYLDGAPHDAVDKALAAVEKDDE